MMKQEKNCRLKIELRFKRVTEKKFQTLEKHTGSKSSPVHNQERKKHIIREKANLEDILEGKVRQ